eukprot:6194601-Pleurochrysis_carterae.AAC.1
MANGASTKVVADVASIGVSTMRSWLQQFCEAVIKDIISYKLRKKFALLKLTLLLWPSQP